MIRWAASSRVSDGAAALDPLLFAILDLLFASLDLQAAAAFPLPAQFVSLNKIQTCLSSGRLRTVKSKILTL